MAGSLIPDRIYSAVIELTPEKLMADGVRVVFADLDNTLARYRENKPSGALSAWKQSLEQAGITLFVVSNSRKPTRVSEFCERLEVDFIGRAGKPKRGCFDRALARVGAQPEDCAMVGDQIFTDIWGANRAGIRSWLIEPIAQDTIFRRIRYGFEGLFRNRCRDDRRCGVAE